jgi:hypothetical protein
MIVDEQAIDCAILGLFFKRHPGAGGRLAYATLQGEWPGQNFRAADLDPGLMRLLRRGELRLVDEGGMRMVVLTDAGLQHRRSLGSIVTRLRSNLGWLGRVLHLAKPRQQRAGRNRARRHRAADPQAVTNLLRSLRQH